MKKITAILLLSALLFNIVGYRFIFNYFEQKSVTVLEQKIDAFAYNESELNEITVPLNMPYYSDKSVENIYGEVEINGQHYQYVKRKIENNILHIWCLNNIEKNRISALKSQLSKSNTDNNSSEKNKNNLSIKIFQIECTEISSINLSYKFQINILNKFRVNNSGCFSVFNPSQTAKPPENVLA